MTHALILIDIQQGFSDPVWGTRNNPDAEENAARLLKAWRAKKMPVFHIRHLSTSKNSPLMAGTPGAQFNRLVAPVALEAVLEKTVNSGFIGTDLESRLRQKMISHLVICGLTTPHCVSSTARMAANLGFDVSLAHDACAAFSSNADNSWNAGATPLSAAQIHDTAISQIHGEFVQAKSTESIIKAIG
ncbi:MAG TPA: cysteine hydrolase [Rhodobacteraceae bacterium]|jgi:nicotinamidase-related amidase|nr:cysteine hydrolase [Paracoccaceae bacterium]